MKKFDDFVLNEKNEEINIDILEKFANLIENEIKKQFGFLPKFSINQFEDKNKLKIEFISKNIKSLIKDSFMLSFFKEVFIKLEGEKNDNDLNIYFCELHFISFDNKKHIIPFGWQGIMYDTNRDKIVFYKQFK